MTPVSRHPLHRVPDGHSPVHPLRADRITSDDGLPLTYYRCGEGRRWIVVVSAPGTSVRVWGPVLAALRPSYSLLAFEYRGFPDADRALSAAEAAFPRVVDDLAALMGAVGADQVHLVTWCLGAKLAWELYRRHPGRVRSIAAVGIAYQGADEEPEGVFAGTMAAVRRRVDRDPRALATMSDMLRLTGVIPGDAWFRGIARETPVEEAEAGGADEPPGAALPYHLNGTPAGLRNYLWIYDGFRRQRITDLFPETLVPVTIVTGTDDPLTPLDPAARGVLDTLPRVAYREVQGATHYLPLEFPQILAALIREHVERAAPAP